MHSFSRNYFYRFNSAVSVNSSNKVQGIPAYADGDGRAKKRKNGACHREKRTINMTNNNYIQVAFMPYAPIDASLQIGNYEIWPYYEESSKRIKKEAVIRHLNRNFGRYFERKYHRSKGGYDKPLEGIYIISPKGFEIGKDKFSETQIEEIKSISHIIAFCAINDHGSICSTSDAFILYIQNFRIESNGIAIWNKYFTDLDMVKFMKPYHLDSSFTKFGKTQLCDALGEALKSTGKDQAKRIFRALELFFHTATHDEMITDEHRVLFLVMCFEVLLNFENKVQFVEKIETLLSNSNPQMEARIIKIDNKDTSVSKSKTIWWAFDLYNLRSAIVHGKSINWETEKYGSSWARLQFGGLLLRKLIKKILSQESLWKSSPIDSIMEANELDKTLQDIVSDE